MVKKEWELLRNELPGLQITVPTSSLGLVKSGRKFIKRCKSLLEDVEALHMTVTDEKTARTGVEREMTEVKDSVEAPHASIAKLAESKKLLRTVRAEVAS